MAKRQDEAEYAHATPLPIKGQRRGTYWLTYFRLDSSRLGDLRRQCQITEDILRVLFLKIDPRIVDALVALRFVLASEATQAHELLERIVSMLTKMTRMAE